MPKSCVDGTMMRPPRRVEAVVPECAFVEQRRGHRPLPARDDALTARIRFEARARVAEDVFGKELRRVVEVVDEVADAELVVPAQLLIHLRHELVGILAGAPRHGDLAVRECGRGQRVEYLHGARVPEAR